MDALRLDRTKRFVITILYLFILTALILMGTSRAYAGYKATEVFYAWDEKALSYQNSNVIVAFDGDWIPLFHEVSTFDNNVYPDDYLPLPTGAPADACVGVSGSKTKFAGTMELGLYHTDLDDAPGFEASRNWHIVSCDRTGDGKFTNADLSLAPGDANMVPYAPIYFEVLTQDEVRNCSTGNCATEIVTTMYLNFDTNCDGVLDTMPAGGLCFFAEAKTPYGVAWKGPIQARITAGGGDKTVNFSPDEPTAVSLTAFGGSSGVMGYATSLGFLAAFSVFGTGALALIVRQAKRRD